VSYFGELRDNVRPLAAASIGSGTGLGLIAYTTSVFGPHLIKAFGWSRSQFALIGLAMLTTLVLLPLIGRLTDRFGVKRMAVVGTLLMPLCFVGYSRMQGSFAFYFFLCAAVMAVGSTTSILVYSRLIAENFVKARGLALTVVNCTPAVIAMVAVPLLNWVIELWSWREAYLAFGVFVLVANLFALALIPPARTSAATHDEIVEVEAETAAAIGPEAPPVEAPKGDYALILRSGVFWIITVGLFLGVLQGPLHAAQMNLMLVEQVGSLQTAAWVVSIYAFGTIVGRILCGLALDKLETPIVASVSMGLPAVGFLLLALPLDQVWVVSLAMLLVGVSVGAESDLSAFLAARYFKLRIYSTTLGMIQCASFLAGAAGAGLTSLTLKLADSYVPYLYLMVATIAVSGVLFLFLPKSAVTQKVG